MTFYHIERKVRNNMRKSMFAEVQNSRRRKVILELIPDKVAAKEMADLVCPKGKIVSNLAWLWIVQSLKTNHSFKLVCCKH